MLILRLIFRVRRLVFIMLFQNRIQAVAEPAIPSGSWLISRVQPLRHPSGGNRSAWLFLAQLAWLSQAEPSSGNTSHRSHCLAVVNDAIFIFDCLTRHYLSKPKSYPQTTYHSFYVVPAVFYNPRPKINGRSSD